MTWKFCKVSENIYYFGELTAKCAQGYGMMILNLEKHFFGEWENGKFTTMFGVDENDIVPDGNFDIFDVQIIYDNFEVYNQVENFSFKKTTEELLYTEEESVKYDYNDAATSMGITEYTIRRYRFEELSGIFQILKSLHILFLLRENAHMLFTRFMIVNFSSARLEFLTFSRYNFDPFIAIGGADTDTRKDAYFNLIEIVKVLHQNKIAHDNINPESIAATVRDGKLELVFKDFSRAWIFPKNSTVEGKKIKSLLTRNRAFRAPETYNEPYYNPFQSDIFSLYLTISAFEIIENPDELSKFSDAREYFVGQVLDKMQGKKIIKIDMLKRSLDREPSKRPNASDFTTKSTTCQ